MKNLILTIGLGLSIFSVACSSPKENIQLQSKLFMELPDSCPTPDGMTLDGEGNLILACPNYADTSKAAVIMKINKTTNEITKLVDSPILKKTKRSNPMGIDFAPDGSLYLTDNQAWLGTPEGQNEGRILKLNFKNGKYIDYEVVAYGMSHPNGIKYKDGYLYVTQSLLPKFGTKKLTSAVYRFKASDRNIKVNNDKTDKNILQTFITHNIECQYGLDGLIFNSKGELIVGNFGDGTLHKIIFDKNNNVKNVELFALGTNMRTIDGICIDENDNIYVADFSENRINKVDADGIISIMAQNGDCDGSKGGLDQPGEAIVFNGKLVVSCFDIVTGPDKVNTKHDKPYTLAEIELKNSKK